MPSGWVEIQLREAPSEQLETWSERLLEASRLEEVFASQSEHWVIFMDSV